MTSYQKFSIDDEDEDENTQRNRPARTISSSGRKTVKICVGIAIAVIFVVSIITLAVGLKKTGSESNKNETDDNKPDLWSDIRLPSSVRPSYYYLRIEPNLSDFTYKATETVVVSVSHSTDTIVMHSNGLDINYVSITNPDGVTETVSHIYSNTDLEYVYFQFENLKSWFESGQRVFSVNINFTGEIRSDLNGFYRSHYEEYNETMWLATTDFEPTDARKAFVCFDEPAMKANFILTLVVEPEWTAISNMPEERINILPNGKKEVNFKTSVKMSTYLVCFIVCKFSYVSDTTSLPNVKVRVWTTPSTVLQGTYALSSAVKALSYYNTYFGIDYPLPKLDLIAIPDYPAGAMENWGCITFRQTALLYDEEHSSSSDKQRVATVIAHELAHQWFGNLVTMRWWSDLWLNEGFASFMEYVGTNAIEPDWEMWAQFLYMDKQVALSLDALETSHPVSVTIDNPSEIEEQFDTISYSKGASIILQLQSYLNSKDPSYFNKGLTNYLKSNSYSNADNSDLWSSLGVASSDLTIKDMMNTWTNQAGYPVLNVDYDENQETLTIQQSKFSMNGTKNYNEEQPRWIVPLQYRKNNEIFVRKIEAVPSTSFNFPLSSQDNFLVNVNGTGYYRVRYSQSLWQRIYSHLSNDLNSINAAERATLVDDTWNLVVGNLESVSMFLDTTLLMINENDYVVWRTVAQGLAELSNYIQYQSYFGNFQKFVRTVFEPIVESVGWETSENEKHTEKLLRGLVLNMAARNRDLNVIEKALEIFSNFTIGEQPDLDVDLRSVVYLTVAENGEENHYDWLLWRYTTATVATEKERCLSALTRFKQPYLIERTLSYALDEDVVRPQDTLSVFRSMSSNANARDLAWAFFKENFQELYKRYGAGNIMDVIVSSVTSGFSTQVMYDDVKEFFQDENVQLRTVDRALERIVSNINWLKKNSKNTEDWLANWIHQ